MLQKNGGCSEGTARLASEEQAAAFWSYQPKLEAHLPLQVLVNPEAGKKSIPVERSQLAFTVIPFQPRLILPGQLLNQSISTSS